MAEDNGGLHDERDVTIAQLKRDLAAKQVELDKLMGAKVELERRFDQYITCYDDCQELARELMKAQSGFLQDDPTKKVPYCIEKLCLRLNVGIAVFVGDPDGISDEQNVDLTGTPPVSE